MKAGDKIFDKKRKQYGVVTKFIIPESYMRSVGPADISQEELVNSVRQVQYQPYENAIPAGAPTIVEVTQIILLIWSIWEPLVSIVEQVRDWLTPDPARVAARQEARRIRKEAKKHLPQ